MSERTRPQFSQLSRGARDRRDYSLLFESESSRLRIVLVTAEKEE